MKAIPTFVIRLVDFGNPAKFAIYKLPVENTKVRQYLSETCEASSFWDNTESKLMQLVQSYEVSNGSKSFCSQFVKMTRETINETRWIEGPEVAGVVHSPLSSFATARFELANEDEVISISNNEIIDVGGVAESTLEFSDNWLNRVYASIESEDYLKSSISDMPYRDKNIAIYKLYADFSIDDLAPMNVEVKQTFKSEHELANAYCKILNSHQDLFSEGDLIFSWSIVENYHLKNQPKFFDNYKSSESEKMLFCFNFISQGDEHIIVASRELLPKA